MTLSTQVETPVDLIKTSLVRMGGLISGFASITGKRHSMNEDACLITQRDGRPNFFGVADGVGGGAHGEIASYVLLEHLANAASEIVSEFVP